jgi:dihydrolipoamide dehydrogenase
MGARATDLIAEAALALSQGLTAAEVAHTVHAHPTLPEAMAEAALDVDGRAVHIAPRKR